MSQKDPCCSLVPCLSASPLVVRLVWRHPKCHRTLSQGPGLSKQPPALPRVRPSRQISTSNLLHTSRSVRDSIELPPPCVASSYVPHRNSGRKDEEGLTCHLFAQVYKGSDEILLSKLILDPSHSILKQSFDSRLRLVCSQQPTRPHARHPLTTLTGHPTRPEQCRWLRHRLLHGPEARVRPLPLHLDHTGMELHEPPPHRLQDGLAPDLRARARHDRGIP